MSVAMMGARLDRCGMLRTTTVELGAPHPERRPMPDCAYRPSCRVALWSLTLLLLAVLAPPLASAGEAIAAADAYAAAESGRTLLVDTREAYEKAAGSPAGVGAE